MNDAYVDADDLTARERRRKRHSLLAAAAAVVVTIAWLFLIETLAAKARTQGPLAEAYYWGYSVPPFLLSWFAAVVASAFPGRSWLRFCVVYAAIGTVTLTGPARALFEFSDKARATNERASSDARAERLLKEQVRLTRELNDEPPFGPARLTSAETIASNENRLGALLDILAKVGDLEDQETARAAPTSDSGLRALLHDSRREQAETYRQTRAALALLRTSWGRWSIVDQRVKFEAGGDEAQFRTLYEKAAAAELRAGCGPRTDPASRRLGHVGDVAA